MVCAKKGPIACPVVCSSVMFKAQASRQTPDKVPRASHCLGHGDMVCITLPKRPEALLQQANSDVVAKARETTNYMCLGCRARSCNQKPPPTWHRGVGLITLDSFAHTA